MEKKYHFCPQCKTPLIQEKIEDRIRFMCSKCNWIHYENPVPCVAAFVQNSTGDVLLIKRGVEPALGQWALPSGFIELDETPEIACVRELEEETGLYGSIKKLLGVFSQESKIYNNVLIIAYLITAEEEPSPGSDALEARYFPVSNLPKLAFPSHIEIIRSALPEQFK